MKSLKGIIDQGALKLIIEELEAQRQVVLVVPSADFARQLKLAIPARLRYNLRLQFVNREEEECFEQC